MIEAGDDDEILACGAHDGDDDFAPANLALPQAIDLGPAQESDEWALVAGLQVVESFRGSFESTDREDAWVLDDPSEEVTRGVAWTGGQSGSFGVPVDAPQIASQRVEHRSPSPRVIGLMAMVGSSGVAIAAAVLLGLGLLGGVAVVTAVTAGSRATPVAVTAPPQRAPAPRAQPSREGAGADPVDLAKDHGVAEDDGGVLDDVITVDDRGEEVGLAGAASPDSESTAAPAVVAPPRGTDLEPEAQVADPTDVITATAEIRPPPASKAPPADEGVEAPRRAPKRGLFGKRKSRN